MRRVSGLWLQIEGDIVGPQALKYAPEPEAS